MVRNIMVQCHIFLDSFHYNRFGSVVLYVSILSLFFQLFFVFGTLAVKRVPSNIKEYKIIIVIYKYNRKPICYIEYNISSYSNVNPMSRN